VNVPSIVNQRYCVTKICPSLGSARQPYYRTIISHSSIPLYIAHGIPLLEHPDLL
jgi:hypothetical protein